MPTKNPRIYVTFTDPALYELIIKDSAIQGRTDSGMVERICKLHYAERESEAELFSTPRLREAKPDDVPFFRTPAQREVGQASKIRENLNRDKT